MYRQKSRIIIKTVSNSEKHSGEVQEKYRSVRPGEHR